MKKTVATSLLVLAATPLLGLSNAVAEEMYLVRRGKTIERNLQQTKMDAKANPFWIGWTQRKGKTIGGRFVLDRRDKNLKDFSAVKSALGDCEFTVTFTCDPRQYGSRGGGRGPWIRLRDRGSFGFLNKGSQVSTSMYPGSLPLKAYNGGSPINLGDGKLHTMSAKRVGKVLSFYLDGKKITEQKIDANANLVFRLAPMESSVKLASIKLTAAKFSDKITTNFKSLAPIKVIFDGTGRPQETVSRSGGARRIKGRGYAPGKAAVYRIPSLVVTKKRTILAFCEARASGYDWGHIKMVVRRSEDNGKTWGKEIDITPQFPNNSCGNPSPVVDGRTGRVFLAYHFRTNPNHSNSGPTHAALTYSDDDGKTWSKSKFVTAQFKPKHRSWFLIGPGHGIQLTRGKYKGRLVIPCYGQGSGYLVYSDEKGKSWKFGGSSPNMNINEAVCVELLKGDVMINARSPGRRRNRGTCVLMNGGTTLKKGTARFIPELPDPSCQGCTVRFTWPSGGKPGIILYAGPGLPTGRVRATMWASYDEGKTWPFKQTIYEGGSGYSDMAVLPCGMIAYLFEKDGKEDLGFTILPAPPAMAPAQKP